MVITESGYSQPESVVNITYDMSGWWAPAFTLYEDPTTTLAAVHDALLMEARISQDRAAAAWLPQTRRHHLNEVDHFNALAASVARVIELLKTERE